MPKGSVQARQEGEVPPIAECGKVANVGGLMRVDGVAIRETVGTEPFLQGVICSQQLSVLKEGARKRILSP